MLHTIISIIRSNIGYGTSFLFLIEDMLTLLPTLMALGLLNTMEPMIPINIFFYLRSSVRNDEEDPNNESTAGIDEAKEQSSTTHGIMEDTESRRTQASLR